MRRTRSKLLVVTRHTPLPTEDGAGKYLSSILNHLASHGVEVHVAWVEPHEHIRWTGCWRMPTALDPRIKLHLPGALEFGPWRVFHRIYWEPRLARLKHRIKRFLPPLRFAKPEKSAVESTQSTKPSFKQKPWMRELNAKELLWLSKLARTLHPTVILANYSWMTNAFDALPSAKKLCLQHDVAWKRAAILAAQRNQGLEITAEKEAGQLARADQIFCISETDQGALQDLVPGASIHLTPMAVTPQDEPLPGSGMKLLYVGSNNSLNIEGLTWFLETVWPRILASHDACELTVCGNINTALGSTAWKNTIFKGRVEDLGVEYKAASVVIVPLLQSTGLNIKLVEAASYGKAIVASPCVLGGGNLFADTVCIADLPEQFAEAILNLLKDEDARLRLGQKAQDSIRHHFNPETCYKKALAACETAIHQ